MTAKHLFILLLALFACAIAQSEDELHIPVENDNQFPPDNHYESDGSTIEGSGAGVIDEPLETTTEPPAPLLEDVQKLTALTENVPTEEAKEEYSCPKPCVCNIEGDTNEYIVDCSGYQLTELPKQLDEKTTELNLQNNMLTEIPKDISTLKNLKILNVNNNEIKELGFGSISELPELRTLKLENNRLIEYPQDLKNSYGLIKLEELDLGGNDMRTDLKPEIFSNFKALRSLTLPTAAADLVDDLCISLKESLETVCTGSCNTKSFECPDAPQRIEDGLVDFALPGLIAFDNENVDTAVNAAPDVKVEMNETRKNVQTPSATNLELTESATWLETNDTANPVGDFTLHSAITKAYEGESNQIITDPAPTNLENIESATPPATNDSAIPVGDFSLHSAITKASEEESKQIITDPTATKLETTESATSPATNDAANPVGDFSLHSAIIKASEEVSKQIRTDHSSEPTDKIESEVVGATTSETKTGGVDKSLIGIIVAGMVLIVAGITIKKNWSSIRNRFSSTPRNPNDRTGINANGTTPEEVPLQEKSPV